MALAHRRHINIFAVVAPVMLAEPLSRAFASEFVAKPAGRAPLGWFATIVAVAASIVIAVVRAAAPDPQENIFSPANALSHVPARVAAQPVFNEDVLGGFLVWNGIKTFIDSRQEMVSDAFFENYNLMCDPNREAIVRTFARYRVAWTILGPTNGANSVLDTLPGWRVVYADRYAVVHVRDDLVKIRFRSAQTSSP
jgi:hypothetical protein